MTRTFAWLDDGLTTRQASTVENYRRLADHAIGKLGAVKGVAVA